MEQVLRQGQHERSKSRQRAEGTGCSRGGASSDRNLNYVVTQALGSLGPSFPAQPDLLKLDLGSVSREDGGKPGLVSLSPPGVGGKAEEVGKDERKADSKKGERRLVFPSLGPSSLLSTPCWGGSWPGRWLLRSFQLPPSAAVYNPVPNSVLSRSVVAFSLPPSLVHSLIQTCFATSFP